MLSVLSNPKSVAHRHLCFYCTTPLSQAGSQVMQKQVAWLPQGRAASSSTLEGDRTLELFPSGKAERPCHAQGSVLLLLLPHCPCTSLRSPLPGCLPFSLRFSSHGDYLSWPPSWTQWEPTYSLSTHLALLVLPQPCSAFSPPTPPTANAPVQRTTSENHMTVGRGLYKHVLSNFTGLSGQQHSLTPPSPILSVVTTNLLFSPQLPSQICFFSLRSGLSFCR